MNHLESELAHLNKTIIEMMDLARTQLEKAKIAFLEYSAEVAEEIIHHEKRVNAMELAIDRDCENLLALFQPVATDLRYVISVLKINSDLERIGDLADGIADYVVDLEKPISSKAFKAVKLEEMFEITIVMMTNIQRSFETGDANLARKVYKKDAELNTINRNASRIITTMIKEVPEETRALLFLFSTIRKLERVGDHIKNVAEDTIFYLEAKVLKHKKDREVS
ncbi:MAG: phosphate signaling complex protein PhoU [Chitinophagales bacterium]|nr:phosphate signaling complex protein PhoU [Chitinophagales bacterium]